MQECNFDSRSILIPYEEFLSVRSDDYEILKKNTVSIITKNKTRIDGVIIQERIWNNSMGVLKKTEYNRIIEYIITYSEWGDEWGVKLNDNVWLEKSYMNICKGSDHINNFIRCRELTKYKKNNINIVDSFLILSKHEGR